MGFRLACVQFRPDLGMVESNLDRIADCVRQAVKEEGADLVVFPETAVSGYYVQGGANENALTSDELGAALSRRLTGVTADVLVGFYERSDSQPYNSAGYFSFGPNGVTTVGVYRKFFLPTYTVFDEDRYVARGTELGLFETRFGRIGVLICEDAWHSVLGTLLALRGAQMVCTLIASPARGFQGGEPSNVDRYDRMLRGMAEEHGVFTASAMLTGFEGGKGLAGGSVVYDPFGERLVKGDLMDEHIVVAEIDFGKIELARSKAPLLADLRGSWGIIKEMVGEV